MHKKFLYLLTRHCEPRKARRGNPGIDSGDSGLRHDGFATLAMTVCANSYHFFKKVSLQRVSSYKFFSIAFFCLFTVFSSFNLKAEEANWTVRELAPCPNYVFKNGVSNFRVESNASSRVPTTITYYYLGTNKKKILGSLLPGQSQEFHSLPSGTLIIGDEFSCGRIGCIAQGEVAQAEGKVVQAEGKVVQAEGKVAQDLKGFLVKSTGNVQW